MLTPHSTCEHSIVVSECQFIDQMGNRIAAVNPNDKVTAIRVPVPPEVSPVTSIKVPVPPNVLVVTILPGAQPIRKVNFIALFCRCFVWYLVLHNRKYLC